MSHERTSVAADADGRASSTATREQVVSVEIDGRRHEIRLHTEEPPWAELARRHKARSKGLSAEATGAVTSPMQGTVLSVAVAEGEPVRAGELICVVEAMKMENEIVSHGDGVVAELRVAAGDQVSNGQVICVIARRVNAAPRCADLSERAGEPLGATATTAENWLLVEVPGTWPRDVVGRLRPSRARTRRRSRVAGATHRRRASCTSGVREADANGVEIAFVVHAAEARTEVRRIELTALEELAALDLSRAGEVTDAQLVLVCGHGTRDQCCALRGSAVYGSLSARLGPEELWYSSHQGGHRFAANVLVLPAGVQLGRVAPDDAPYVVARALAGRVVLDRYRGRTAYAQGVQAAERAVREAQGLDAIADLRLIGVDGDRVRLRSWDGREHVAEVEEVVGPVVPASCGADAAPQAGFSARLL